MDNQKGGIDIDNNINILDGGTILLCLWENVAVSVDQTEWGIEALCQSLKISPTRYTDSDYNA